MKKCAERLRSQLRLIPLLLLSVTSFAGEAIEPVLDEETVETIKPDGSKKAQDLTEMEEITVTAQGLDRTLKDTSNSVAVFRQQDIDRFTERTLEELYQRIPNITTAEDGDIVIRGIDRDGVGGAMPTHLNFVDGEWNPFRLSMWDSTQVEVLRGSDTLTSSAMGGVTALSFIRPSFNASGAARISHSPSTDDTTVGLAYGNAIIDDSLAFRLSMESHTRAGYTTNTYTDDDEWNDSENYSGLLKVMWLPSALPDTRFNFMLSAADMTKGGGTVVSPVLDPKGSDAFHHVTSINTDVASDQQQLLVRADMNHTLNERWSLEALLMGAKQSVFRRTDRDADTLTLDQSEWRQDIAWTGGLFRLNYRGDYWTIGTRNWLLDIDIPLGSNIIQLPFDVDGPGPAAEVQSNLNYEWPTPHWLLWGAGVFASRDFGLVHLDLSLRAEGQTIKGSRPAYTTRTGTTGDSDADAFVDFIYANFFTSAPNEEGKKISTWQPLPLVSMSYDISRDLTAGFKYERSKRFGWFEINALRNEAIEYDDETSDSVELFFRTSWLGGRVQVNSNVFYTKIKDQQVRARFSSDWRDEHVANAQRSHIQGLEFDSWIQWDNIQGWIAFGVLEAEYDEFVIGEHDWSGQKFANASRYTLSGGGYYDSGSALFASLDANYVPVTPAGSGFDPDAIIRDSRLVVNGRIGWKFKKFELSFYARNLLDKKYFAFFDPGERRAYVGAPRELGATFLSRW